MVLPARIAARSQGLSSVDSIRGHGETDETARFTYCGNKHAKSIKLPYNVGEKVVVNLEAKRYRDVREFVVSEGQ